MTYINALCVILSIAYSFQLIFFIVKAVAGGEITCKKQFIDWLVPFLPIIRYYQSLE